MQLELVEVSEKISKPHIDYVVFMEDTEEEVNIKIMKQLTEIRR